MLVELSEERTQYSIVGGNNISNVLRHLFCSKTVVLF